LVCLSFTTVCQPWIPFFQKQVTIVEFQTSNLQNLHHDDDYMLLLLLLLMMMMMTKEFSYVLDSEVCVIQSRIM
jgi:hypothetical protein